MQAIIGLSGERRSGMTAAYQAIRTAFPDKSVVHVLCADDQPLGAPPPGDVIVYENIVTQEQEVQIRQQGGVSVMLVTDPETDILLSTTESIDNTRSLEDLEREAVYIMRRNFPFLIEREGNAFW